MLRLGKRIFAVAVLSFCTSALLRGDCSLTTINVAPLNDAGARFYNGFQCGLYPRGGNARPPAHDAAAVAMAAQVQPLDTNGNPNAAGKIVMISVGMSNTTQEFSSAGTGNFKARADADPAKNPQLIIVDGAQGGQDATAWLDPSAPTWTTVNNRLSNAGVTPSQVQVCWLKQAIAGPNNLGAFPAHAQTLQNDLAIIARNLKTRFPNIRICYFSSRTRAYTNVATSLNPEPFAFEGGFSTKWLIEDQIAGRGNLNWDVTRGAVVAPLLCWGPYIWADGTVARSDGFTWLCSDLQTDFTHPSPTGGVPKVGEQLLTFFKTDATTTPWFLRSTVTGQPPTVTASASLTSGNTPLSVNFTASASDPDGSITGYQWTFDDGTFSTAQNPTKIFTAPGVYDARLTVTDNSGNTVKRAIAITVTQTLSAWKSVYFTPAELGDPNVSGDSADIDRDGRTTVEEYGMGLNPKLADSAALTVAAASADHHLTLTFPRTKAAVDVQLIVEAASDPAGPWSSGADITSEKVIADDGVVQTIRATDQIRDERRRAAFHARPG